MIYVNDEPEILTDSDYNRFLSLIPAERRRKALSYCNLRDRKKTIAAFLLLRKGLKIEYGFQEVPEIAYQQYGKPYFKDFPEIHFNISHCENAVACVISSSEVGLDIEDIKPFDTEVAKFVCDEQELNQILKAPDISLSFTILWTKKESYLKMKGIGLSNTESLKTLIYGLVPLPRFETIVNNSRGYVLTTCIEGQC